MKEEDILYERGDYFIIKESFGNARFGKTSGYAVYKNGDTHSKRVASIGYHGEKGLFLALSEIDRRINLEKEN